jgi:hypothetical protein
MNKVAALPLILLSITALYVVTADPSWAVSNDCWVSKKALPTEREGLCAAVVNGKIYAVGGWSPNEMYDPNADNWITLQSVPTSRAFFGTAVFRDKIYIIGGLDQLYYPSNPSEFYVIEGVTGVNEVYDPVTNTWETKTPMPTPRDHLQANIVDSRIFLIGGQTQQPLDDLTAEHTSNLTEVYDPATDSWTTMASIPNAVYSYASVVVDGKIYVISGMYANSSLSNLVQIFDPQTNSWSFGKPIPTPMNLAAAGATTGIVAPKRIYVFGGSKTQVYDPEADTWSSGADMPTYRYGLAVAVVNDTLYALGGSGVSLTDANEQYTPIGYGTVTPSPSTTATQSPELTPTQSPTASAYASEQPNQEPGNSGISSFNIWLVVAVAVGVAVVVIVFVLRRRG